MTNRFDSLTINGPLPVPYSIGDIPLNGKIVINTFDEELGSTPYTVTRIGADRFDITKGERTDNLGGKQKTHYPSRRISTTELRYGHVLQFSSSKGDRTSPRILSWKIVNP